jgi:excinuclease ABC subunit A
MKSIRITRASENNLRAVSLEIPGNSLIVVTGVSGSGKSSLVFDVLYREAESRYFSSFSSHARQFLGKMKRPDVEAVEGLSPAIALQQRSSVGNPRSTVGTLTGIYDHLRLLFARTGKAPDHTPSFPISRSLFSFNSPEGACPSCKGLGVEDHLDPELLISDENKTLREGALVLTTPNGYIIYSQVTMDVLDQVCRSEGFHVDIPWKDLAPEQKHIVLYGSNRIEIPYGKHPLESRMRWSGITAKPREMGHYKGILPVMENILRRDRNKNILRFVRTGNCPVCQGQRLNPNALSVTVHGHNIAQLSALQLDELQELLNSWTFPRDGKEIADRILPAIAKRTGLLSRLGLGYLSAGRESTTLSGGETQRLRLASQCLTGLSGVLYCFDEPSVGLHPHDTLPLIGVLKELRDQGNTVIVVEHDEEFIRHADWLVDIGPGPGVHGGEVLLNIPVTGIALLDNGQISGSRTLSYFTGLEKVSVPLLRRKGAGELVVTGAKVHNLKEINVRFLREGLNVVTGVSGAGKSTLTHYVLAQFLHSKLEGSGPAPQGFREITGWEGIGKLIEIDQAPIGRTPRSNPATYTGLFDPVRDLFAAQPESVARRYGKSRFSFNTAGGRCETCEGAGYLQIGMHFMGNVEVVCETCEGRRFDDETLEIRFRGKNIYEVLEMTVSEALAFFEGLPKILRYLESLDSLGLGYLTLGQRSSTLSGGEAQRVKLAAELAKTASFHTLYILDEPTTGLHNFDVANLLTALNRLVDHGHTIILIEHHQGLIASADRILDLGPGSGRDGGHLVFSGTPEELVIAENSLTGAALKTYLEQRTSVRPFTPPPAPPHSGSGGPGICLTGVTTNNLKNLTVTIPGDAVTVITGVSGSGKSSLAFDTIHAEGQSRFLEGFSTYFRTQAGVREKAGFEEITGLTPTFAVDQRITGSNPRSTVGTMTGIYDLFRLLWSRIGRTQSGGQPGFSSVFSFNHEHGACPVCDGLGEITVCDPDKLITDPGGSILSGAMDGTRTGKFYGDPYGQYVSTLKAVGQQHGVDFSVAWAGLSPGMKQLALYGTGEEVYEVDWEFRRNNRTGTHHFSGKWAGLTALVNEEYRRKHADHRAEGMKDVMMTVQCPECSGTRLRKEALEFLVGGIPISTLSGYSVSAALGFFQDTGLHLDSQVDRAIAAPLVQEITRRLSFLNGLGLSYLATGRSSASLSGGETQRIRLAAQLGSGLTGMTYVLDEPTLGLHPADTRNLMSLVRELREAGNTIIITEHDREVILAADHILDLGPGAGRQGGEIVAEGSPAELIANPGSVTGPFLAGRYPVIPSRNRTLAPGITLTGASAHTLNIPELHIPARGIILVTGVSGSGKSSLVFGVLNASLESNQPVECKAITGHERFRKTIRVHPRSTFTGSNGTPATYTGVFDRIRDLFSRTEEAVKRNLTKNHFSFLGKEGRCERCQGAGRIRISMDFLADVWLECDLCGGKRYRDEILTPTFKGATIADVLGMTFTEASLLFKEDKNLRNSFEMIGQVGLGYLQLGQPLETLSGGESQRLMMATGLFRPSGGEVLYLLEEPSTGLHFLDLEYLMALFHRLADDGHTLVIIDHDPDVILHADWVIDLGPGAGDRGGQVVAQGRVADILHSGSSLTGECLSRHLSVEK